MAIRFGIVGCGNIAPQFVSSAKNASNCSIVAVASREYLRAEDFAKRYCPEATPYGSYEQLCADPSVDAVYVATPHSHHYEHVMLALRAGKHVLCEKSLTTDCKKLKRLFKVAKDEKLVLMEGMWSRFLPALRSMCKLIKSEKLGKVKSLSTSFCCDMANKPDDGRLKSPELAGGALFDLGIYTLNSVFMITDEKPVIRDAGITFYKTGVDATSCMTLQFNDFEANIKSSIIENSDNVCTIVLENGSVKTLGLAHNTAGYIVETNDTKTTYMFEDKPVDFSHEISHFNELINKGEVESPIMGEEDSLKMLSVMDEFRMRAGLKYPFDEEGDIEKS